MFSNKTICLFDFDGTLVDSMSGFADVASDVMFEHLGLPRHEGRKVYLETSGVPFFQQLDILFPGGPRNGIMASQFEARKLEGFFSDRFFSDVPSVLALLRSHGIQVGVCSNNLQENIERYVASHEVLFDHVLGFRHPDFEKGEKHFQQVMGASGVGPQAILFVGDSLKDGERAGASGIDFVGRLGTFSRAQFEARFPAGTFLDDLSGLPCLLGIPGC